MVERQRCHIFRLAARRIVDRGFVLYLSLSSNHAAEEGEESPCARSRSVLMDVFFELSIIYDKEAGTAQVTEPFSSYRLQRTATGPLGQFNLEMLL